MDGTAKCKLPSTPQAEFNILAWKWWNFELETSKDVVIWRICLTKIFAGDIIIIITLKRFYILH
jgi:hypothetical protein